MSEVGGGAPGTTLADSPPEPPAPRRPVISALSTGERLVLALAFVLSVVAGTLHFTHANDVLRFVAAAGALSLLATVVGHATDNLGSRLGPSATGVLQSALGNLPELLICVFSLRAGLVDVVRSALVGSILANQLLVLGLAIVAGGLKHGTQRFSMEAPRMIATLMLLAVAALTVPTLAHELHTPAEPHEARLSAACAVVLLVVFFCTLPFSLRGDPAVTPEHPSEDVHTVWPLWLAVAALAFAGVGAGLVSEWFVDAMLPATQALGLSQAFTGLVIVAIAGNAVENVVGIVFAAKNKPDYAMGVILNSSLQIALVLTPVLVLLSFFVGPAPLTLVLSPLLVVALALGSLVSAFIVYDGESIWVEGVALVGLYVMVAASVWWG